MVPALIYKHLPVSKQGLLPAPQALAPSCTLMGGTSLRGLDSPMDLGSWLLTLSKCGRGWHSCWPGSWLSLLCQCPWQRGTFLPGTPRKTMATQLRTTCYPYSIRFREGWIRRSTQPPGNCSVLRPWKKLMKMEKRQRERLKHPRWRFAAGRPGICSCSDNPSRGPNESHKQLLQNQIMPS